MQKKIKALASLLIIGLMLAFVCPQVLAKSLAKSDDFKNWPAGTSPQEVGKRVAENFAARQLEVEQGKREFVIYPEVCAWSGALTVARLTHDKDLEARLIQKFAPLLTPAGSKRISSQAHVDYRVFGVVPLEIYMLTKDKKYLALGQGLADKQWEKTTPDGITT